MHLVIYVHVDAESKSKVSTLLRIPCLTWMVNVTIDVKHIDLFSIFRMLGQNKVSGTGNQIF